MSVQQETPGNLDPARVGVLVDLVKLIKASAPAGANALPTDIVPAIEETVRAHFAKECRQADNAWQRGVGSGNRGSGRTMVCLDANPAQAGTELRAT